MRAGTGFCDIKESYKAGSTAAAHAVQQAGGASCCMVFTTDSYNQEEVLKGVSEAVGKVPLVGCCTGGIIANDKAYRSGVGVMVWSGKELQMVTTLQPDLSRDPVACGQQAGELLLASGIEKGTVLVLPDGFQSNPGEFLSSLYNTMGPNYQYIGGGSGDNIKFFKTYQFTDAGLASNAVALALISGCDIGTSLGHGWVPIGDPMVITRAEGRRVYEIDGIPAFQAYAERLGKIDRTAFAHKGMQHPFGFPDLGGHFLIRDPIRVMEDDSIVFVTEVPSDAIGNIMSGDIPPLVEMARMTAQKAVAAIKQPRFVLAFDCISRAMLMKDRLDEELQAIRSCIGARTPLLGALTFGEIGSYVDVPLFHNKTVVVAAGGGHS